MQYPVPVTEFQPTKRHSYPSLNIGRKEDQRPVFNDEFEVGVKELQDQVEVRFRRKDVQ